MKVQMQASQGQEFFYEDLEKTVDKLANANTEVAFIDTQYKHVKAMVIPVKYEGI